MSRPWEISGDDIAKWADRYDAPAVLPKLVRRLLAATTPLDGLEMRADAGVRFGGWDGVVRARDGHAWCPRGLSVWELSVAAGTKAKLDKDLEKRSAAPPDPALAKVATYVAVVGRRIASKERWVREKNKRRGAWFDVRLLDADDLAAWLEAAPAVGRWFAGVLGKPSTHMTDFDTFLEGWSRRTSPPLPWELVLAGEDRQDKAKQLVTRLAYPPGRPLYVRGETREEALLFAAAAMAKGPQAERWLGRGLLAETDEAWRWALSAQRAEPLVVLPTFKGADPGRAGDTAYAILAVDKGAPVVPGATLDLERLPYKPLGRALVEAGWQERSAEDLVERAGGSLAAMQRLSGYVELKGWAKDAPRAELMALLMAGAWMPSSPLDREAITRLGGDPDALERVCMDLHKEITRTKETWAAPVVRWRAPDDAWKTLAGGITETLLGRFRDVVMEVLGVPVKAPTMQEQMEAAQEGKALSYSGALSAGLAESIARLAVSDDLLRDMHGTSVGADAAEGLVRRLLDPERGWQPWALLSSLLPTLAQAAPNMFLDVLDRSLDLGDKGVSHLFALEPTNALGGAPHTGLLWALEALGWHPEIRFVGRVAMGLARLAAEDPGGQMANRPIRSLSQLLDFAIPQSATSVDDRLTMLDMIFEMPIERDVGWSLALGWIHAQTMHVVMPSYEPKLRTWPYRADRSATSREWVQQIEGALGRLIEHASVAPDRWAELVSAAKHLAQLEGMERRVLDALSAQRPQIVDPENKIWAALREQIHHIYRAQRGIGEWRHQRLESLYGGFCPADLVKQVEWLFSSWPKLPERVDLEDERAVADKRREEALALLWEQTAERWSLLAKLIAEKTVAETPGVLGFALAESPFADELEARLFHGPRDEAYDRILAFFGAKRAEMEGAVWLESLLRHLVAGGRLADAVNIAVRSPDRAEVWDKIDAIGDPLRKEYWRRFRIPGNLPDGDPERVTRTLLEVGNDITALHAVSWSRLPVTSETALRALEAVAKHLRVSSSEDDARAAAAALKGFDLERVFAVVDRDAGVDGARVLAVEMAFLPWLTDSSRSAKYLARALGETPSVFLALLAQMYRRAGEAKPENDTPEDAARRARVFENARGILRAWRGYPGDGLPEEERDEKLETWAIEVLDKATEDERGGPASVHVAEILARVPDASDGFWPCVAARRLVDKGTYPHLADQLPSAKYNLRGVVSYSLTEGGAQERDLAQTYRAAADQLQDQYPRTAAMLDALARTYEAEAEQHDAEAHQRRIEYGEDEPQPAAPKPTSTPAKPARFITLLETSHVDPAPSFHLDLGRRLNLLVGDNSLGKTFALDVLWWSLTGTWAGEPAKPARPRKRNGARDPRKPTITVAAGKRMQSSQYDPRHDRWPLPGGRPLAPGLAIYARVDGGFSIWDPIRNAPPVAHGELDLSQGYHFHTPHDLWDRTVGPDGHTILCRGLLDDAVAWRNDRRDAYAALEKVIADLSPPGAPLRFGKPDRFGLHDARQQPTLLLSNGQVFLRHASAAVKRILSLAYVIVWSITEIQRAAPFAEHDALQRVTLLIDEIEAHLHPRWQREILPALLGVVRALVPHARTQLVVSTHAPLVLASIETRFRDDRDALFHFALAERAANGTPAGQTVEVHKDVFRIRGDASAWLTAHDVFGLPSSRARDVEKILEEASRAMTEPDFDANGARELDHKLRKILGQLDPFWVRWRYVAEKRGWLDDTGKKKARPQGLQ